MKMTSYRPGRERWGRKLVMPSSGPGPAFPCRDPALRSWTPPGGRQLSGRSAFSILEAQRPAASGCRADAQCLLNEGAGACLGLSSKTPLEEISKGRVPGGPKALPGGPLDNGTWRAPCASSPSSPRPTRTTPGWDCHSGSPHTVAGVH